MAQLQLSALRKDYGPSHPVVRGIDLTVQDGEFLVMVGPSGCGKSTTLRMIAGLEEVSSGSIVIGGDDVTTRAPAQRGVSMVFQSYALYPHMTVAQNMGFGLKVAGLPKAQIDAAVQRAAQTLQLEPLLGRKPRELSGGQRQRVAIGRAIVRDPKVFLFDEPLSNLDASLRGQMRVELSRLHESLGTTIVYVTHDQVEAMTLGQRIAVFNQGRIEQVGPPMTLYRHPVNRFVAAFLGSPRMNFLQVQASRAADHSLQLDAGNAGQLTLPADVAVDAAAVHAVGWRPEHVQLLPAGDGPGLQATVELVEQLGDVALVHCRVAGQADAITLKLPGDQPLPPTRDAAVRLLAEPQHAMLFDAQGLTLHS
jgi:multiple sugar transport system ATP-binding protein